MIDNYQHTAITAAVIRAFYTVYNTLGHGFLEKVYENALAIECKKSGLNCLVQCPIDVYYDNERVGFYIADMIVNRWVVVEIKAATSLCIEHEIQLTNYLKATEIEVGLLLNLVVNLRSEGEYFLQDLKRIKRNADYYDDHGFLCFRS